MQKSLRVLTRKQADRQAGRQAETASCCAHSGFPLHIIITIIIPIILIVMKARSPV